ncbi:hypothetical protein Acid345_2582 [Candidatus Koribacter versatilis Ellin345]|uniref:Peptidase C39-like domain-containing protein n=1 Tax=Koribacter versatilis (strain Ellin345) TaxID=204669 RepID=Q1ING7_KORVE|nr:papain-like cysteine protease family protein [Candidatus Koribacter versatilis]ABF41583.1 hypothetical protein Acid345_2582 [Candidatus Koribacter versatilis Ellin345]
MRLKWIALVALALSAWAGAQKTTAVGIPSADFNFASAVQLKTDWCWAASVQMVLNWYHIPVKQTDVVGRIYGKPVDKAASEDEITVALSGTAYDRDHHKVLLRAKRIRGVPPTDLLVDELERQRPVLLTIRSTRTMLHAVVLTSAEYEVNKEGHIHVTSLTYRDPNPSIKSRKPATAIQLSGAELGHFVRSISSYYLVSMKKSA